MEIEKVSFYRHNVTFYKNSDISTSTTVSMISLPRVKFLENDGPYRPKWAIDYKPKESIEELQKPLPRNSLRHQIGRKITTEITALEQEVADLIAQGFSVDDIHDKIKKTRSTIVSTLNRYKRKIALMKGDD